MQKRSLNHNPKYVSALRSVLRKTDYVFYMKQLHGLSDFQDPWYCFSTMKASIESISSCSAHALKLLHLGIPASEEILAEELGQESVDILVESGMWKRGQADREGLIETDNYIVMVYQGMALATDISPSQPTCTRPMTDVYIGSDSLRLAENIAFDMGARVLDLCSGSGIQGILAARSASRVVSVEINEHAASVIRFNAALNGLQNVIDVRCGDLYSVLEDGETFDYIYANPPFLPVIEDVAFPVCGAGGEDGLDVLRRIIGSLGRYLKEDGRAVIFCESLGDSSEVFFDRILEDEARRQGWQVDECRYNRIGRDRQLVSMATILDSTDPGADKDIFKKRMNEIYDRLGAEYLYSLLYRIRKNVENNENATSPISIIDHCPRERTPEEEAALAESILKKIAARKEELSII